MADQFDQLAKALGGGLPRRKALMGGILVALGVKRAWAADDEDDELEDEVDDVDAEGVLDPRTTCPARACGHFKFCNNNHNCFCARRAGGGSFCFKNFLCRNTHTCHSDHDCSRGWKCVFTCCFHGAAVCAPPCPKFCPRVTAEDIAIRKAIKRGLGGTGAQ